MGSSRRAAQSEWSLVREREAPVPRGRRPDAGSCPGGVSCEDALRQRRVAAGDVCSAGQSGVNGRVGCPQRQLDRQNSL